MYDRRERGGNVSWCRECWSRSWARFLVSAKYHMGVDILNKFRLDGEKAFVTAGSQGIGNSVVGPVEAGADFAIAARVWRMEEIAEPEAFAEPALRATIIVTARTGLQEEALPALMPICRDPFMIATRGKNQDWQSCLRQVMVMKDVSPGCQRRLVGNE